ncbi:hypothetical protein AURDEDRAFT_160569 [Auricularia subglabra TFB-10046 SS5]|nr:hypothetical protein AURDEDRAFT_160569 [Auricularia subglabra TFB-10046 SS5]
MPGHPFAPDASQHAPRTRASIARNLLALGLHNSETLLLHSSPFSLGWVCGGAEVVVQAILDVLGPEGTLVVPTQTEGPRQGPGGRPFGKNMPAFGPARAWAASLNTRSFAAVGRRAHELVMDHHPLECRFGEESPLGRMLGARILLLGVDVCTAFHLTEYRIPGAPRDQCSCTVNTPGGRDWVTYIDTGVNAYNFAELGEAFEA